MKVQKFKRGFTQVIIKAKTMIISHCGNMGNSIIDSVNPNLNKLGFGTIEELKLQYITISESGSPDYSYGITFKM